jgi:hypothetical protein
LFVGYWQLGRWQGLAHAPGGQLGRCHALAHAPGGKTGCNLQMTKDALLKKDDKRCLLIQSVFFSNIIYFY